MNDEISDFEDYEKLCPNDDCETFQDRAIALAQRARVDKGMEIEIATALGLRSKAPSKVVWELDHLAEVLEKLSPQARFALSQDHIGGIFDDIVDRLQRTP